MRKLLAGDVGATKTILGIYSAEKGPQEPLVEATFPSAQYPGLVALVSTFLSQADLAVEDACFGVAGPVVNGQATSSNLSWRVDQEGLKKELGLNAVILLNDVEATAQGVPLLKATELHCLNKGDEIKGGTKAVIAAGTGLGEAFLSWDGARFQAHASEGGHANFAPANPLEDDLLQHLRDLWGHVSYERICTGMGLPYIYSYLKESGYVEEPAWLAQQLAGTADPTALIVDAALEQKAKLCTDTVNLFCSVLGAAAGNLALTVMALGGVYLGGGIPLRIITLLEDGLFMEAFCCKGRLSELMARIPVYVILDPKIALIGAAFRGLELFPG
ncbi:MAG: glucokinase [Desulfobacterales bacterium]|nr:glucokinase [Desulfobacterales bacterium]